MTTQKEELVKWLQSTVEKKWLDTGKAYLLSQLGLEASRTFPSLKDLMPDGIKRFIGDNSVARIVTHSAISQKVGAIPNSAVEQADPDSLFARSLSTPHINRQRYNSQFWRSFHTPLSDRRFVIITAANEPKVRIVERTESPAEGQSFEILSTDIVSNGAGMPLDERVKAVQEKINSWIDRHNIDSQLLYEEEPNELRPIGQLRSIIRSQKFPIDALSHTDQSRIMIPLDIVIKLLDAKR
jgi:hypothetical protein